MPERTINIAVTHHQSDSPIDRNSAIALGVLLLLILLAIAWYVRPLIRQRRQGDEERLTASAHRHSVETLKRHGARVRTSDPVSRTERLWRRGPEMMVLSEKTKGTMRSWSSSRASNSTSSGGTTRAGSIGSENACGRRQDDIGSRSPSPHSVTTPPRSNHRRKSSIHDVPDLFLAELQMRRPPAPSQTQCDRRWWTEVARRGSAAQMNRRFSVLEPIPEPGEVVVEQKERRSSEAEWKKGKSQAAASKKFGHDWTMLVAGASEKVDRGRESNQGAERQFKSIVWSDQCLGPNMNKRADASHIGTDSKRDGAEGVDWVAIPPGSQSLAYE